MAKRVRTSDDVLALFDELSKSIKDELDVGRDQKSGGTAAPAAAAAVDEEEDAPIRKKSKKAAAPSSTGMSVLHPLSRTVAFALINSTPCTVKHGTILKVRYTMESEEDAVWRVGYVSVSGPINTKDRSLVVQWLYSYADLLNEPSFTTTALSKAGMAPGDYAMCIDAGWVVSFDHILDEVTDLRIRHYYSLASGTLAAYPSGGGDDGTENQLSASQLAFRDFISMQSCTSPSFSYTSTFGRRLRDWIVSLVPPHIDPVRCWHTSTWFGPSTKPKQDTCFVCRKGKFLDHELKYAHSDGGGGGGVGSECASKVARILKVLRALQTYCRDYSAFTEEKARSKIGDDYTRVKYKEICDAMSIAETAHVSTTLPSRLMAAVNASSSSAATAAASATGPE